MPITIINDNTLVKDVIKFSIEGNHQYHMAIIKYWCDNGYFNPRCHQLVRFRDSPYSLKHNAGYNCTWERKKPKRFIWWRGHTGFGGSGHPLYVASEILFYNMLDEATIFRLTW